MKKRRSSFYGPGWQIVVVIAMVALVSTGATRVHPEESGPIENNNSFNSLLPEQDKPVSPTGEPLAQPNSTQDGDDADEEKVIIVGKVISNHCHLSSDGKEVQTDYRVWVNQVQEGSLLSGNIIIVTIRGGMVLLKDDGSEVRKGNTLTGKAKKAKVRVEIPHDATSDTKIPVQLSGVASTKFTPFDLSQVMQHDKIYLLTLTKNPKENSFRLLAPPSLTDN